MSNKTKEEQSAGSIADPFVAAFSAGRLEKQAMGNVARENRFDPKPIPSPTSAAFHPSGPPVVPGQPHNYLVCDQAYKHDYGKGKLPVLFYQYYKQRIIRAVARKDGVTKQRIFTPEIASLRGVPFDMVSAIAWIREVGFKGVDPIDPNADLNHAAPAPPPAPKPPPQRTAPPPQQAAPPPQQRAPAPPAAPPPAPKAEPASRPRPASTHSGAPLKPPSEGKIMFMGEVERPARDGKPAYTIYAISIRGKFDRYNTDFSGVHLSELAVEHGLQVGMSIQIQPLGKRPTTVFVNGEWKSTFRNEFSITVL